jgi:DEAD/DEAH box helicase domain-containing protein
LAVLVGSDYPIDMHYMLHPDELFERPMGELIVDIENKVVLEAHLQCAAHEMPLCKIILVVMSGDD